jgi:hypothetical protein
MSCGLGVCVALAAGVFGIYVITHFVNPVFQGNRKAAERRNSLAQGVKPWVKWNKIGECRQARHNFHTDSASLG